MAIKQGDRVMAVEDFSTGWGLFGPSVRSGEKGYVTGKSSGILTDTYDVQWDSGATSKKLPGELIVQVRR